MSQTKAGFALETRAERTAYDETSRYDDVMAFVKAADAASPLVHLTTFGYSGEGRPLPLVVVGRVKSPSADAVRATGLTRVYIQANIHGGEVEGKEAVLQILRALVNGEHAAWLETSVLLFAPIYNADGNERIRVGERPLQNGPLGGVGRRPNAQELDLNRDHMKLESPEARSMVRLLRQYDPHVTLDLHTTNGTYHAYQLTYSVPLHPNTSGSIVDLLRARWMPEATRTIRARDGWDFFYYGNVPGPAGPEGGERGWYTFDHRPRFNNNYIGLRNRVAILSEAYAYLPFKARIDVTRRFVETVLGIVARDGSDVRRITVDADAQAVVGQTLALTAKHARGAQPLEVLMGGVRKLRHPLTGQVMLERTDERRTESMPDFSTFEPAEHEQAPAAYLVPSSLERVVELLQAHGVKMEPLAADAALDVETFVIAMTRVADREFQGHRERSVSGAYERSRATIGAGTWVVPLDQPLGRLVFTLLEPRSDDGIVNWNVVDELFATAGSPARMPVRFSIVRSMRAVP